MQKKINFFFPVDDVFRSLIEVENNNLSLKDHFFLSYLYNIYKTYDIKICLNLFYEKKVNVKLRNLSEKNFFLILYFYEYDLKRKCRITLDKILNYIWRSYIVEKKLS